MKLKEKWGKTKARGLRNCQLGMGGVVKSAERRWKNPEIGALKNGSLGASNDNNERA